MKLQELVKLNKEVEIEIDEILKFSVTNDMKVILINDAVKDANRIIFKAYQKAEIDVAAYDNFRAINLQVAAKAIEKL